MDLLNIRRNPTSKGLRSVLTYWYRGVRYRPVLGYNLKPEQERDAAFQVITAIHANTGTDQTIPVSRSAPAQCSHLSFAEFIPTYLQYLRAKRPDNDGRNEIILTRHLVPFFGPKLLSDIRLQDGLGYLEKRRTDSIGSDDNKHTPAPGTIERE